jgi:hypothetical protein
LEIKAKMGERLNKTNGNKMKADEPGRKREKMIHLESDRLPKTLERRREQDKKVSSIHQRIFSK